MIGRLVFLGALAWTSTSSAQLLFRHPSTCGAGCAQVGGAYFDHGGRDWNCGGQIYGGHRGTDFWMGRGNQAVAAAPGTVTRALDGYPDACTSCTCSGTNMVTIRHDDGTTTEYLHLMRGTVAVSNGQRVSCGQLLGRTACSGQCCGPHLHFHFWLPGSNWNYRKDPFAGGCSDAPRSYWVDRGPYRSFPGQACQQPDDDGDGSPRGEDCDDHDARRTPGRAEDCDGIDNDCDTSIDEGDRRCGSDEGECRSGRQRCVGLAWGPCDGEIPPRAEGCDRLDNDCDGEADEERICEVEESETDHGDRHSDIDGDGDADACAWTPAGIRCLRGTPHGFGESIRVLDTGEDWYQPAFYATLRTGDVDGDERADVCARSGDAIECWRAADDGFARIGDRVVLGELPEGARAPQVELADVTGDGSDEVCVRDVSGLRCHDLATGDVLTLPAASEDAGVVDPSHFGTLRLGDVDGDGRADACMRLAEGMACWLSEDHGFGRRIAGPTWSDADGWGLLAHWSTIRLRDVDGDGRADLCGAGPDGFACHLSEGSGFGARRAGPDRTAAWADLAVFKSLRLGDVDGDGSADVCVREREGVQCWLWSGAGFGRMITGPRLRDEEGWANPARAGTLRLADVDGDHRDDLCARASEGLRCFTSSGPDRFFDRIWTAAAWSDEAGFDAAMDTTLRMGTPPVEMGPHRGAASGGCGCRVGAGGTGGSRAAVLAVALLMLRRRQRSEKRPRGASGASR